MYHYTFFWPLLPHQASQPVPEVQCWETYHLMYSWQNFLVLPPYGPTRTFVRPLVISQALSALQSRICHSSSISLAHCRQFMVWSPESVQIFQASWMISQVVYYGEIMCHTRVLLDLSSSWDQVMAAFSALHSIIGWGMKKQTLGGILTILTLSWEQDLPRSRCLVATDLARACLRHIQRVGFGRLVPLLWVGCIVDVEPLLTWTTQMDTVTR
jgi:hypothetical protein